MALSVGCSGVDVLGWVSSSTRGAPLLPLMDDLRTVAVAAVRDGVARVTVDNPVRQVTNATWHIDYPTLDIVDA